MWVLKFCTYFFIEDQPMTSISNESALYHQTKILIGFGVGGDWSPYLLFNY